MNNPVNRRNQLTINSFSYDEAFQRRHEIPFRPHRKDRTANIHCNWVYLVSLQNLIDFTPLSIYGIHITCRWSGSFSMVNLSKRGKSKINWFISLNWTSIKRCVSSTLLLVGAIFMEHVFFLQKYVLEEERSRVYTRYHWTSSEDDEEQMNVTNTTTSAEQWNLQYFIVFMYLETLYLITIR